MNAHHNRHFIRERAILRTWIRCTFALMVATTICGCEALREYNKSVDSRSVTASGDGKRVQIGYTVHYYR